MLERLHKLYSQNRPHSDDYTASLIKNYRCVPEILMLSSNLYYNSTLHYEVPISISKDVWHPLQFICSSVEDIDSSSDNSNEEANILLNEVDKFMKTHAKCKACIVTPSPTQVRTHIF